MLGYSFSNPRSIARRRMTNSGAQGEMPGRCPPGLQPSAKGAYSDAEKLVVISGGIAERHWGWRPANKSSTGANEKTCRKSRGYVLRDVQARGRRRCSSRRRRDIKASVQAHGLYESHQALCRTDIVRYGAIKRLNPYSYRERDGVAMAQAPACQLSTPSRVKPDAHRGALLSNVSEPAALPMLR